MEPYDGAKNPSRKTLATPHNGAEGQYMTTADVGVM